MTSAKYIGLDVHKEHADSPIMPTAAGRQRLGGARVASGVGIIRGFLGKPIACHQAGIASVWRQADRCGKALSPSNACLHGDTSV